MTFEERKSIADRLRRRAQAEKASGATERASLLFLEAASAYGWACASLSSDDDAARYLVAARLKRGSWSEFIRTSDGKHVHVEVPHREELVAFLLRPSTSPPVARTTIVRIERHPGETLIDDEVTTTLRPTSASAVRETPDPGWGLTGRTVSAGVSGPW